MPHILVRFSHLEHGTAIEILFIKEQGSKSYSLCATALGQSVINILKYLIGSHSWQMLQSAACLEPLWREWGRISGLGLSCPGLKWKDEAELGWQPKRQLVQNTWNLLERVPVAVLRADRALQSAWSVMQRAKWDCCTSKFPFQSHTLLLSLPPSRAPIILFGFMFSSRTSGFPNQVRRLSAAPSVCLKHSKELSSTEVP